MSTKQEQRRRRETLRPHSVRDQILDAMATYTASRRSSSPTKKLNGSCELLDDQVKPRVAEIIAAQRRS